VTLLRLSTAASGNVRWSVPNEQPQIATDDNGVIGQSGITYDANGNATGQIGYTIGQPTIAGNGSPNWAGQIYTTGTSGVQFNYSWIGFGTGFSPVAGANPSGNATSVANLGKSEGLPLWSFWSVLFGSGGQKCTLGTNKVPLGGVALLQYNTLKQNLLTFLGSLTPTSACSVFFNASPQRSPYLSQLTAAVTNQVPYDGLLSNINIVAAGWWNQKSTPVIRP
jgi:hypothetical protein